MLDEAEASERWCTGRATVLTEPQGQGRPGFPLECSPPVTHQTRWLVNHGEEN